jgi:hypothetical protein
MTWQRTAERYASLMRDAAGRKTHVADMPRTSRLTAA